MRRPQGFTPQVCDCNQRPKNVGILGIINYSSFLAVTELVHIREPKYTMIEKVEELEEEEETPF